MILLLSRRLLAVINRKAPKVYGGQGPGRQQWRRWPEEETRTTPEAHTRTGQAHMRSDMRVPANVRAQLSVTGVLVGGHLCAGLQGVQRGHRDGADHVPDD